jgi:hemerythrin-like domain-containing protein
MNVTEELKIEHQFIIDFLLATRPAERSMKLFELHANDILLFINTFLDKFHHGKEEQILFKYLSKPGVLNHTKPIDIMIYEHDLGRDLTQNMEKAVQENEPTVFFKSLEKFCSLLNDHILKEDNVLYHLAEKGLSLEDKVQISMEYKLVNTKFEKGKIWDEFEEIHKKILQLHQS